MTKQALELNTLEDLLAIDENDLKSPEKSAVIRRVKQMLKTSGAEEKLADEEAKDLPYEAVAVVGKQLVKLRFDLETKEARVVDVEIDSRDVRNQNHMATHHAIKMLEKMARESKGK